MSDPYRLSGGPPCLRCTTPMVHEDGELVCPQACGRWIGNAVLDTLLPAAILRERCVANMWKAPPFHDARCIECAKPLAERHKGLVDPIAFGQCDDHGIWIDMSRVIFEAMFAADIREHEDELEIAKTLADPALLKTIVRRLRDLERAVEQLDAELARLRNR